MLTPSGFIMKKNLTIDFMRKKNKEYNELKKEIKKLKQDYNE